MQNRSFRLLILTCLCCLICGMIPPSSWSAGPEFRLSKGQTLYVPVYSKSSVGPKVVPFPWQRP